MLDSVEKEVMQHRSKECIIWNRGVQWVKPEIRKVTILADIVMSGWVPGGEVEDVDAGVPVRPIGFVLWGGFPIGCAGGETQAEETEAVGAGFVVYVQNGWDEGIQWLGERVGVVVLGFPSEGQPDADYAGWGGGEAPDLESKFNGQSGE